MIFFFLKKIGKGNKAKENKKEVKEEEESKEKAFTNQQQTKTKAVY